MNPTEHSRQLGQNIARLRKKKGWSQSQLSNKIRSNFPDVRMTENLVSRLERGTRALSAPDMNALVSVLGVPSEQLLPAHEPMDETPPTTEGVDMEPVPVTETFIPEADLDRIADSVPARTTCLHTLSPNPYCTCCNYGRAERPKNRNTYLLCRTCSAAFQSNLSDEYDKQLERAGIKAGSV